MPAKRKTSKTKKKIENALEPPEATKAEGNANEIDTNTVQESSSVHAPAAGCIESEPPQATNFNEFSAAVSVEDKSGTNDAQAADVDPELETQCQPLTLNPEQCFAAEVPSVAENTQPDASTVLLKKKSLISGAKKKSQKQNEKFEDSKVTWEVSRGDEGCDKNVVRFRRQHLTGIPDVSQELAAEPVQMSLSHAQEHQLCETACDMEERHMMSGTFKNDVAQEHVQEHVSDSVKAEAVKTACTTANILDDNVAKDVDSIVSTKVTDVVFSAVRLKRHKKVTSNTEGCRRSQRCSLRRQESNGSADIVPAVTSASEAKTYGFHIDDKSESCLVSSAGPEVQQEQVMTVQTSSDDRPKTATSVSCSTVSHTEASTSSSDQSMSGCYSNTAVINNSTVGMSVASNENSDLVPEVTAGLMDESATEVTSEDQPVLSSASEAGIIQSAVSINIDQPHHNMWSDIDTDISVKVGNSLVKPESNYSYSPADFNSSSRLSNATALLNTCLSQTILDTAVSPVEQPSSTSLVDPHVAAWIGKETDNEGVATTPNDVHAELGNSQVNCEVREAEEVCQTIVSEVVASIIEEACLLSASKENDPNMNMLVEPCEQLSQNAVAVAQHELDGTSEEIPLKKRRGRRRFENCDPDATSHQNGGSDRHPGISNSTSSYHRKKFCSSFSRRHQGIKYVGAHTSVVGNVACAVHVAAELGSQAFGMFIKPQNQLLPSEPLSSEEVTAFKKALVKYGYSPHMILPHGSYLLNCGSSDPKILHDSRESLVDDLQRCRILGLPHFNFHPGSFGSQSGVDECIERIAESINYAHSKVQKVVTVLENMTGQTGTIGGDFLQLRRIINRIKDKSRIGICLDTCHAFAYGYDIRTESGYDEMMHDLEQFIGLNYLKAVHINDSRDDAGSHLDHHANIGHGRIGQECFRRIMNDHRFDNLPMILETPWDRHQADIDLMYSFVV